MLKFHTQKRRGSLFISKVPYPLIPLKKSLHKLENLNKNINNQSPDKSNSSSSGTNSPQKNESCNISSKCKAKTFDGQPLIDNEAVKVFLISCNKNTIYNEIDISSNSSIPSPNDPTFDHIFKEKVEICNYIFNFKNSLSQFKGKAEKSNALLRLNALLSKKSDAILLTSEQKDLLLEMINRNLFDQDPFIQTEQIFTLNLQINFVEPAWNHYSVVFKILNQFVTLFPEKCTIDLVKKVIRLMNIPDVNERENLVTVLKNYTKVHIDQFDKIWKHVKDAIMNVRYLIYSPFYIDPIISYITILTMQNTIPNNMNIISQILRTHLLPLFDHPQLSLFFPKLSNLVIQLIDGNFDEQLNVIQYLIMHFPIQCGQKQPLFFTQLSLIIQTMQYQQLNVIAHKIFNFIVMAIKSPNFKLAESALLLLMKPNMKPIIFSNYELAMDLLYEPLKWASSFYWEKNIKNQSSVFLSTLMNARLEFKKNKSLDNFFVDSPFDNEQHESKKIDNKELAKTWASVFRAASKRDRSIDLTKSLCKVQIEFTREDKCRELERDNSDLAEKNISLSSMSRKTSRVCFNDF